MAIKKFAVVGNPIKHSLSPKLFKAGFRDLRLNYSYYKEEVNLNSLKLTINKLRSGKYNGLSITVPYKEVAIKFLDKVTTEALSIGAVNTVFMRKNKIIGDNTDWHGFKKTIQNHINLKNKKILIYGAGGAARACIYALSNFRDNLLLTNRTELRGKKLASDFGIKFIRKDTLPIVDVLINATSSGINSKNKLIVSKTWLKKCLISI